MKKNTEQAEHHMPEYDKLEQRLEISFQNKDLLTQAFVHRSYLNENPGFRLFHNERLEFLGDAVLELVVTRHLYDEYPDKPEGDLTSWRAALVNTKMLSLIAKELDLNAFLLLSHGETKETGKARDYILANTVEALIGALYLDQEYEEARKFITKHILQKLGEILEQKLFEDPKSLFQEMAQEKTSITPSYHVLKDWGPDHAKNFQVGIYLAKDLIAEGEGSSKQEAEQDAARNGLVAKGWSD